jgi:large subunit ribosomal protein L10
MENPRPEKVAVVDEVRTKLSNSQAALLTEYRGIGVADMSALRRSLREAGGEYKIYKNTLVRFAARDLGIDIDELLTGTTAIAFVPTDSTGDPVLVAKALRDFAKTNQNLVVKGGVLGDKLLSAADAKSLADVAPREVLLSQFAGALQAPMANMAALLQAPMQNFAGLLKALIEDKGGVPEGAAAPEAPAADESTDEPTASTDEPVAEAAPADETPAAEDAAPAEPAAETNDTVADAADTATEEN